MSPLFGHKDHDEPDSTAATQQLRAEVGRLAALTLPQLAAEVMRARFTTDYEPDLTPVLPSPWTLVPDDLADTKFLMPPDLGTRLRDLAAEGAQLLEHKSLIRPEAHYSGLSVSHGYLTTRAGREALVNGTLEQILAEE
jgi:hypothetical protein